MTTSKVNFVNIPQELKNNASFCVWKMEKRQGKPTKVPYNPKTGAVYKGLKKVKQIPAGLRFRTSALP